MTNDTQLILRESWKDHFNIMNYLTLIDNTWTQVTYRTLNPALKKLWPVSVAERDFEGFEPDDSAFIDEVAAQTKTTHIGQVRC